MMREFTDQGRCATAMSIYQGSDAIVLLFYKALVINSGRQIFYGKASEAKEYFEHLGFECLPTTTVTDFLNSMSANPEARLVRENTEARFHRRQKSSNKPSGQVHTMHLLRRVYKRPSHSQRLS